MPRSDETTVQPDADFTPFDPTLAARFDVVLADGRRVELRAWTLDHLDDRHRLIQPNVEYLLPWLPWAAKEPLSRADATALIDGWQEDRRCGRAVHFAMWLGERPVGGLGVIRKADRTAELGYFLDRAHWGLGIVTTTVRAMTNALLARPDTDRVLILHEAHNERSRAVPERLGFTRIESSVRPGGPDELDSSERTMWRWCRTEPISSVASER